MMSYGTKTQAAHLGQLIFLRAAQKKEKNDLRQNVTEEYDSQESMTGYPPYSFHIVPFERTRRSHTSYMVHTPNTTVIYDCESYF
jgi:hypothetical protein